MTSGGFAWVAPSAPRELDPEAAFLGCLMRMSAAGALEELVGVREEDL